MRGFHLICN